MWTRIPSQPELASQSASTLEKLLGNRFCHYEKTRMEKNGKNRTERYGIPNFRRFRKSLATSREDVTRMQCRIAIDIVPTYSPHAIKYTATLRVTRASAFRFFIFLFRAIPKILAFSFLKSKK